MAETKLFNCFAVVVAIVFIQGVSAGVKRVAVRQESGENENLKFAYDSHTHMLMLSRQAVCYICVLTDQERMAVHTDTGLRNLELKVLGQITQANLTMITVPKGVLHTNILKECGKGTAQYRIVQ